MNNYLVGGNLGSYKECNDVFQEIKEIISANDSLVIDFEKVRYISSAGIGRLASLDKSLWGTEKNVNVINVCSDVQFILETVEVKDTFRNIVFADI